MDNSPIHLACDRWTILFMKHFLPVIHGYFDELYDDAIEVAKTNRIKDYNKIDGLFQVWCRHIQEEWTDKERNGQINILRANYRDLEGLISSTIISNLYVMSSMRQSDVVEIPKPEIHLEKFINTCYWFAAKEVAYPYPIFFNKNVTGSNRVLYHCKARKLIQKSLEHAIIELVEPILDQLNEQKKKKKKRHHKKPGKKYSEPKDINVLTEDNLKKFTEQHDKKKIEGLKNFQKSLEYISKNTKEDEIGPDDSASYVYRQNEILQDSQADQDLQDQGLQDQDLQEETELRETTPIHDVLSPNSILCQKQPTPNQAHDQSKQQFVQPKPSPKIIQPSPKPIQPSPKFVQPSPKFVQPSPKTMQPSPKIPPSPIQSTPKSVSYHSLSPANSVSYLPLEDDSKKKKSNTDNRVGRRRKSTITCEKFKQRIDTGIGGGRRKT
jgi:hypothetical protein